MRSASLDAGRARDACKVWATLVVAADQSEDETSAIGPARLLTYIHMEGYGELVCKANDWDPTVLSDIRSHPLFDGAEICRSRFYPLRDSRGNVFISGALDEGFGRIGQCQALRKSHQ